MASERAKELAKKQKAEAKALKAAKKNSSDPTDWGTAKQIRETYKLTAKYQPKIPWMLAGAVLICLIVGVGIGLAAGTWYLWALLGLLGGVTAALWVLQREAKKASFARVKGQPGGAEMALTMLDKKKWHYTAAVAVDRQTNCVHRAIGPGGMILIGDGKGSQSLLRTEVRRHQQVLYGVEVQTVLVGEGEGKVPVEKLTAYLKKLPKTLTSEQIEEIEYRLKALDKLRSRVPIPKGPMPTGGHAKISRRAMRG
ncbi:protein of unknown function [Propionibacterium cyclohexanicum]|uniref:DUF4191 domain-containing protein n=1 Tax=Propionibacterium cyclohexanicum TaxID=64702 RepID=A0A1H9PHW4_9ACTN|nr:DUF4191 domain-containing protein [Propionibacterium cyclohexanicum]SER47680.1 protein of unknown function [Propionibacterium cyclohexanicum]